MSFSQAAWRRTEPIYRRILALPFNRELAAGTLARERFVFYLRQDAHYLAWFARALAATAARADDHDHVIQFAGSAREALVVERSLHEGFFRDYGISQEDLARTDPSPTCAHYVHYLVALAHNAPYEVAVAGLLPCFWIYREVGQELIAIAAPDNPYQAWLATYADEAFAESVERVIAIVDRIAAAASPAVQERMAAAFARACQLEWMFWDSAYRQEAWPV